MDEDIDDLPEVFDDGCLLFGCLADLILPQISPQDRICPPMPMRPASSSATATILAAKGSFFCNSAPERSMS